MGISQKEYIWGATKIAFSIIIPIGIILFLIEASSVGSWVTLIIFGIIAGLYITHGSIVEEVQKKAVEVIKESQKKVKDAEEKEELWKQTLLERNSGFKTLTVRISEYEKLRDDYTSSFLQHKSHPAYKAADVVKEETRRRRHAELENKITQAQIELYEQYAPFLADLKEDVPTIEDVTFLKAYSDEEREDEVTNYLTTEEYRALPSAQRNQLALDRFWQRPKSKWLLGKLYERYVGYIHEQRGYTVEYFGIKERYEDMGRDLICRKRGEILIIQCKNWSQFKTIYEKHIFQLFGTVFEYKHRHSINHAKGVFYTTTHLSDLAREISVALGIELFEGFKFDQSYPCIKCNINPSTKEKIYHLPFDQKYDDTKIDRVGEIYCATVAEAEAAGFRRAFRWHGDNK